MSGETFAREFNTITSSVGYSVEVAGRTRIVYREGNAVAIVGAELLMVGHGIAVFKRTIKEWSEPEILPISDEVRERILANIRKAIESQNQPLEIL